MPIAVGPTSLDWPAWIQAVGSVASILVAVVIAHRDTYVRRAEERRRAISFNKFLESHLSNLKTRINEIRSFVNDGFEPRYFMNGISSMMEGMTKAIRPLSSLPLVNWPDFELSSKYFRIVDIIENTDTLIRSNYQISEQEKMANAVKMHINNASSWLPDDIDNLLNKLKIDINRTHKCGVESAR